MWADLVLINGNVLTMSPSKPHAKAIAVKYDKIVEVGANAEIESLIGKNTKVIDLKGRTVVPGLIDTHVHMTIFGRSFEWVNLRDVNSIGEVKGILKKRVQKIPREKWILGWGWNQERFVERLCPTRWDLDEASPNNPVVFYRICGHMCVVNSKTLELAGITMKTAPPLGGQIDKDPKTGEPTGVLRDNAMNLVEKVMPEPSEEELMEACSLACQKAVETGLTSVHWLIDSPTEIRVIQKLRAQNKLPLRVYTGIPARDLLGHLIDSGLYTGFGDSAVKIGSAKIFADGSLGARTAALHEPYNDNPAMKGLMIYTQKELDDIVMKAHKAGFQLAIHAIGDRAIDATLTAIEKALMEVPKGNHRHRIEHASVLNEKLIQRIKRAKVIASIQPHFIMSDSFKIVIDRVGPTRARWVFPFKTLIQKSIWTTGSSDCPVEPINPLLGICRAVAREAFPEERLTVDEALRLYTVNAAYASFEENIKGSIEVGKLADLVILSHDPHAVPPNKIKDIQVETTIVGGRVVYAKSKI